MADVCVVSVVPMLARWHVEHVRRMSSRRGRSKRALLRTKHDFGMKWQDRASADSSGERERVGEMERYDLWCLRFSSRWAVHASAMSVNARCNKAPRYRKDQGFMDSVPGGGGNG